MRPQLQTLGIKQVDRLAHQGLDIEELRHIVGRDERERPTRFTGASRAPNAMDVIDRIFRYIEIDHVADVGDVDAARKHIRCHKDLARSLAKRLESALTLRLRAIAVNGSRGKPGAGKAAATCVGTMLGAGEHDDAAGTLALEHLRKQAVFRLE